MIKLIKAIKRKFRSSNLIRAKERQIRVKQKEIKALKSEVKKLKKRG